MRGRGRGWVSLRASFPFCLGTYPGNALLGCLRVILSFSNSYPGAYGEPFTPSLPNIIFAVAPWLRYCYLSLFAFYRGQDCGSQVKWLAEMRSR